MKCWRSNLGFILMFSMCLFAREQINEIPSMAEIEKRICPEWFGEAQEGLGVEGNSEKREGESNSGGVGSKADPEDEPSPWHVGKTSLQDSEEKTDYFPSTGVDETSSAPQCESPLTGKDEKKPTRMESHIAQQRTEMMEEDTIFGGKWPDYTKAMVTRQNHHEEVIKRRMEPGKDTLVASPSSPFSSSLETQSLIPPSQIIGDSGILGRWVGPMSLNSNEEDRETIQRPPVESLWNHSKDSPRLRPLPEHDFISARAFEEGFKGAPPLKDLNKWINRPNFPFQDLRKPQMSFDSVRERFPKEVQDGENRDSQKTWGERIFHLMNGDFPEPIAFDEIFKERGNKLDITFPTESTCWKIPSTITWAKIEKFLNGCQFVTTSKTNSFVDDSNYCKFSPPEIHGSEEEGFIWKPKDFILSTPFTPSRTDFQNWNKLVDNKNIYINNPQQIPLSTPIPFLTDGELLNLKRLFQDLFPHAYNGLAMDLHGIVKNYFNNNLNKDNDNIKCLRRESLSEKSMEPFNDFFSKKPYYFEDDRGPEGLSINYILAPIQVNCVPTQLEGKTGNSNGVPKSLKNRHNVQMNSIIRSSGNAYDVDNDSSSHQTSSQFSVEILEDSFPGRDLENLYYPYNYYNYDTRNHMFSNPPSTGCCNGMCCCQPPMGRADLFYCIQNMGVVKLGSWWVKINQNSCSRNWYSSKKKEFTENPSTSTNKEIDKVSLGGQFFWRPIRGLDNECGSNWLGKVDLYGPDGSYIAGWLIAETED